MDVMSQLVSQDRFDLIGGKLVDERIAQHDAAGVADAGQRGVGGFRPPGHIELEDPAHFGIGAAGQLEQAVGQFPVLLSQWDIFVEQRHDQDRGKVGQQHRK